MNPAGNYETPSDDDDSPVELEHRSAFASMIPGASSGGKRRLQQSSAPAYRESKTRRKDDPAHSISRLGGQQPGLPIDETWRARREELVDQKVMEDLKKEFGDPFLPRA